ncbi:hypothetical protein INR49_005400 [Caranx melampygus]|nr:hypothetical protein INR49_005400 [Caranx melampygus]
MRLSGNSNLKLLQRGRAARSPEVLKLNIGTYVCNVTSGRVMKRFAEHKVSFVSDIKKKRRRRKLSWC